MILVCLKVRNKIKQSYMYKGFAWSVNFRYLIFTSKTINSFEEYGKRKDNTDITGQKNIQSTLVISNSKGPSETLRDIRTSTYQICRIEESTNQTTKFHK